MSQVPASLESSVIVGRITSMRLAPGRPSFAVAGTDLFGLDGDNRPRGLSKPRFKAMRDRVALCFVLRPAPATGVRAWTKEDIDALDASDAVDE